MEHVHQQLRVEQHTQAMLALKLNAASGDMEQLREATTSLEERAEQVHEVLLLLLLLLLLSLLHPLVAFCARVILIPPTSRSIFY